MLSIRSLFKRKNNSGNNFRITRLEETDSTNAYIHRMLTDPQQSESTPVADQARYSVVTTEFQSSGRGQGTNTWESERGKNLLFSILCHPVWVPVTGQFILSEAIALAIRDALAAYDEHFTIKWPNDIYWQDKKISGTLIECDLKGKSVQNCIVGTGLNVNQDCFLSDAPNPVSLKMITGKEHDLGVLLHEVARHFISYVRLAESGDAETIRQRYKQRLYRRDGFHAYEDENGRFSASFLDVEPSGRLLLTDTENKVRRYEFKELRFII